MIDSKAKSNENWKSLHGVKGERTKECEGPASKIKRVDLPDAEGRTQFLSHRHRRQYRYHSQSWHCPAAYSKWKESTQTSSDVGGSETPNSSWYRCLAELYSQKLGEWPASYFHTSPDGHLSVHAPGVVALPALGVSAKNLGQSHRAQCLLNRLLFLQLLVVTYSFSIKWRIGCKDSPYQDCKNSWLRPSDPCWHQGTLQHRLQRHCWAFSRKILKFMVGIDLSSKSGALSFQTYSLPELVIGGRRRKRSKPATTRSPQQSEPPQWAQYVLRGTIRASRSKK